MSLPLIPLDRPVLGKDLRTFQQRIDASTMKCCCLLGITLTTWSAWNNKPDEPIPNVTAALIVRLYDRYPYLVAREPQPDDLKLLVERRTGRKFPRTQLALMLGRERTSGYRWTTRSPPAASVSCLTSALMDLLSDDDLDVNAFIDRYRSIVETEASLRGVADIWAAGSWVPPVEE